MRHVVIIIFWTLVILIIPSNGLFAQSWKLVKDREGIKVFTREEPGSVLKSFRGEAHIQAPVDTISLWIMDPAKREWWANNFAVLKLLDYQEGKYNRYYMVYGLPWPLANRHLAAETRVIKDTLTGAQIMVSNPLPDLVPEQEGLIRIDQYMQKWTLQPLDKQTVQVILEGFIDPGGYVPDWLVNMLLPETPFRTIKTLREKLLSQ